MQISISSSHTVRARSFFALKASYWLVTDDTHLLKPVETELCQGPLI